MDSRYLLLVIYMLLPGYVASAGSQQIPNHGVILQYHHVSAEMPEITSITPERFSEHLNHLEQKGFAVNSLEQVIGALQTRQALPDKTVVITFDDAYLNIYQTAWPMIRAKGWTFALFVSTELIGSNPAMYMNWEQVRKLHDAGVLIGNHTMHHSHLLRKQAGESDPEWLTRVRREITGAQETLQDKLGDVRKIFAYPYGEYSDELKQVLKELGYIALGQQSGAAGESTDWQEVPRFPASGAYSDLATLEDKLLSLPLAITHPLPDSLLALDDTRPLLSVKLGTDLPNVEQLACYATAQGPIQILERQTRAFSARARIDLPVGRSRYNCTIPVLDGSRYYWISHPWIRRNADGSWYPED